MRNLSLTDGAVVALFSSGIKNFSSRWEGGFGAVSGCLSTSPEPSLSGQQIIWRECTKEYWCYLYNNIYLS